MNTLQTEIIAGSHNDLAGYYLIRCSRGFGAWYRLNTWINREGVTIPNEVTREYYDSDRLWAAIERFETRFKLEVRPCSS